MMLSYRLYIARTTQIFPFSLLFTLSFLGSQGLPVLVYGSVYKTSQDHSTYLVHFNQNVFLKQGDRNAGEGTDWKPRNKEEKEER